MNKRHIGFLFILLISFSQFAEGGIVLDWLQKLKVAYRNTKRCVRCLRNLRVFSEATLIMIAAARFVSVSYIIVLLKIQLRKKEKQLRLLDDSTISYDTQEKILACVKFVPDTEMEAEMIKGMKELNTKCSARLVQLYEADVGEWRVEVCNERHKGNEEQCIKGDMIQEAKDYVVDLCNY